MESFFMFWYIGVGIWVLLAVSLLLTFSAFKKSSWKRMAAASVVSFPNAAVVMSDEFERIMYVLVIWFIVQSAFTYSLYKKENKSDNL